jgi:repressor LexA
MLSRSQQRVLDYIESQIARFGESPPIKDVCQHLGLSSPATVAKHLDALERAGYIKRVPRAKQSIQVIKRDSSSDAGASGLHDVPLLGVVAAGRPVEAVMNLETIEVPSRMLIPGRTFALLVRGDSMVDQYIQDGDFIIVEQRVTANNGDTVVALIDGTEATVKKFYQASGEDRVILKPSNSAYQPLEITPASRVVVQGIVRGVLHFC